jgi:hypothetical protein
MTAEQAPESQEPTRPSPSNAPHPERRPARGVEDVVHLFVTQPQGHATATSASGRAPATPQSAPVVTVASPAPALGKEEILQLLFSNTAALENGLRAIDRAIPCGPSRTIDVLAVDSLTQLVVIALEAAPNDSMLLRSISDYDWIVGHVPILRKLYQGQVINFSAPPRIFLVAPEFSQQLTGAARLIQSPRIGCFRYRGIAVPSGTAVLFDGV